MKGLASAVRIMASNPGATAATLVVAGTWCAIAVNAVFLQAGPHPAPLLGAAEDAAMLAPHRLPPARPKLTSGALTPSTYEEDQRRKTFERELALVRDVQRSLAERGFYDGPVDGLDGPQTEAAIRDYERAAAMTENGEATESLLTHIELSGVSAGKTRAASEEVPAQSQQPELSLTALIESTRDVFAAEEEGEGSVDAVPVRTLSISPRDPRIEAVQRVLADLGYAPGTIDGQIGPETRDAIKSFEADRGLPQTGEVSDRLIRVLREISGIDLG